MTSYIRKDKYSPATTNTTTTTAVYVCMYVMLRGPPQASEKGWSGELSAKVNLFIWEN